MLSLAQIAEVVHPILDERLPAADLHRSVETRLDSYGEPAIFVTVDVTDVAYEPVLRFRVPIMVDMAAALGERGEERFAFLEVTSAAQRRELLQDDAA